MSHELIDKLSELLAETASAHHQAFLATDGADPDWPIWYADHLVDRLPPLLGSTTTQSKIIYLLMQMEEIRLAESPDADWIQFYAERLGGFATSAGRSHVDGEPKVTGFGGIFFKSENPAKLRAWYTKHLGIVQQEDGSIIFEWAEKGTPENPGFTVWGPFKDDTTYFDPSTKPFMFNFRVDDLDGLLTTLREAGVEVDDKVDDYPYGKFGWCMDPEGTRIEFWEPK